MTKLYRVLVTGSRNWQDGDTIYAKLDELAAEGVSLMIIQGGASGADTFARQWAVERGVPFANFPAQWNKFATKGRGNPAGPIRNQQMLDEMAPDEVMAFHSDIDQSRGTQDMIARAKRAGIPVNLYDS